MVRARPRPHSLHLRGQHLAAASETEEPEVHRCSPEPPCTGFSGHRSGLGPERQRRLGHGRVRPKDEATAFQNRPGTEGVFFLRDPQLWALESRIRNFLDVRRELPCRRLLSRPHAAVLNRALRPQGPNRVSLTPAAAS